LVQVSDEDYSANELSDGKGKKRRRRKRKDKLSYDINNPWKSSSGSR
jgi:hypothetical protein